MSKNTQQMSLSGALALVRASRRGAWSESENMRIAEAVREYLAWVDSLPTVGDDDA